MSPPGKDYCHRDFLSKSKDQDRTGAREKHSLISEYQCTNGDFLIADAPNPGFKTRCYCRSTGQCNLDAANSPTKSKKIMVILSLACTRSCPPISDAGGTQSDWTYFLRSWSALSLGGHLFAVTGLAPGA